MLLIGINAKYIHSNPAIYYLKKYVLANVSDTKLYDDNIELAEYTINQEKSDIIRDIYQKNVDVVAISVYLWNVSYVSSIIKEIAKICPKTDIWLGGPEVSFDAPKQLEKYPMIRGIIAGEGEKSFFRLAKYYIAGEGDLPQIMYADKELLFDDVPFPYDELGDFDNRIIYYETSRGCPFGCTYCLSSVDKVIRLRSIDKVKKELQYFLDNKVSLVKFVDRTFNCNPSHTIEILRYIKEHDNYITCFHFEMAAELINDEELALLQSLRPGLVQVEIGIQTTNQKTLSAIHRKSDFEKLSNIVNSLLVNQNMHVHVDLIAGLPFEDLQSFKKSFDDVYGLGANELQLGFLKILKGAPMEQCVKEYDILYLDEPPYEVLSTKWLAYNDIIELKGVEEILEKYYNSGQFVNSMKYLLANIDKTPYELYFDIYEYYLKNDYMYFNHNRYENYRILREYAVEKFADNTTKITHFTECLLHDLYLRDNVKSRPDYGDNGIVEKKLYKRFFEEGKHLKYLDGYEDVPPATASRMIHIEKRTDGYMLYDYTKRNPINNNVFTVLIGLDEV